jgi:hypothetical protein
MGDPLFTWKITDPVRGTRTSDAHGNFKGAIRQLSDICIKKYHVDLEECLGPKYNPAHRIRRRRVK